jgi:hypothetical protein
MSSRRIYVMDRPDGYEVEATGGRAGRRVWDVPNLADGVPDTERVDALLRDLMSPEDADPNDGWCNITDAYRNRLSSPPEAE